MKTGEPLWTRTIRLVRQESGNWEGTLLAPVMGIPTGRVRVLSAEVTDVAGNTRTLDEAKLAGLNVPSLTVGPARVSETLNTYPYIQNLIHIGAMSFLEWNRKDVQALDKLWDRLPAEPAEVRAEVTYDLLALQQYIDTLRSEIYRDPATGYRYVPLNTSGKWRAVDKAIKSRLLLVEIARRDGKNQATRLEKADLMAASDITVEFGGSLEPVDLDVYADGGAALMNSVIKTVARSGLPRGLMQAAHKAPDNDAYSSPLFPTCCSPAAQRVLPPLPGRNCESSPPCACWGMRREWLPPMV